MHHNSKLVNGEMPAGNDYIKNKQKLAPHLNLDYPDSDDEGSNSKFGFWKLNLFLH